MYRSKTRFIVVVFIICIVIHMASVFVGATEENNIQRSIETFVSENKDTTAGLAVAVFDAKQTLYIDYFGYSNIVNQVSVNQNTVFDWGSSAKAFVWISLMQLWEQGKIVLDEDIRTYLPEGFLSNLSFDQPITILNLMNHDAGFEEMVSDGMLMEPEVIPSLHDRLKLHMPDQVFEPGMVTAYSNWGVALAGYIVECVSGMRYEDYVWEHIFLPLGMTEIAIRPDMSDNPDIKKTRNELCCYEIDGTYRGVCNYSVMLSPAGMCCSTLKEFLVFAQSLLLQEEGVLFAHKKTWDLFYSATSFYPETEIPRNCHGLWVTEYAVSTVGHSGNSQGCSSAFYLDLQNNKGMVIMTNQYLEQIYNTKMPEVIFGSFLDSSLYDPNKPLPKGSYRIARTIWDGPFSIYYDTYSDFESDPNARTQVWSVSEKKDVNLVSVCITDLILLSETEIIISTIILYLAATAIIYALCTLVIGGGIVRPIRNRMKRKRGLTITKNQISKYHYISCVLILLWGVNVGAIGSLLLYNFSSSIYYWLIILHGVLGLAMMALTGMIFVLVCKKSTNNIRYKYRYLLTCAAQIIIIISLIRWEMYQFWAF